MSWIKNTWKKIKCKYRNKQVAQHKMVIFIKAKKLIKISVAIQ